MAAKKAKKLVCRFCGSVLENAGDRDALSGWTHNHPAVCPYRQDRMPSLNGVYVGDVWRNVHTKEERTVVAIRLGGAGTYTDREPVVQFDEMSGLGGWPLWSLTEHWESVTRPGEWPVTWHYSGHYRGERSARDKWRTPGYRGGSRRRKQYAYMHAYHSVSGHSIEWERTNVLWQLDPVEEEKRLQRERALAFVDSVESIDPTLAETVARVREMLAEAA